MNAGWGQQVIGNFPYMDGGFENQTIGALGTSLSTTNWSRQNQSGASSSISSISPRSGSNFATVTSVATASRNLQTPNTSQASDGPLANTSYVVQYYVRNTSSVNGFQSGVSVNGTTNPSYSTAATLNSNANWFKYVRVITTQNISVSSTGIGFAGRAQAGLFDVDDFVIYQGTSVDEIAPNAPGTVTVSGATNSSLGVSWGAASGGVDGGGYVVVRYAVNPNADNDPNQNGIYAVGNTITNGTGSLVGTVRYIGTSTSFTDNFGLSEGTQYWYKVYTVDKAFNYSAESIGNGTTLISNAAPVASSVNITGTLHIGQTLTGGYTYSDADNDLEGTSTYQWFRADDASGLNTAAISGATNATYTLTAADNGKHVRFGVTPVAATGTSPGAQAFSSWQLVNSFPVATNVAATGVYTEGQILEASYDYTDADNDSQGTSLYQWLEADDNVGTNEVAISGATNSTYELTTADIGKFIRVRVTPVATTGSNPGVAVFSAYGGPVTDASTPTISVVQTLEAFGATCVNQNSAVQSYTVSALSLTGDVTISAPTHFQIKTELGTWGSEVVLSPSSGTIAETTIEVRFAPTANGAQSGDITHVSAGATTQNFTVSGTAINTLPTVNTPTSASIGTTTVTLGGNLTNEGCQDVTNRGVEYSTTNNFTTGTGTQVADSGSFDIGTFTVNVTGLTAGTTYYYRAFATSSAGTTYSDQASFATLSTNANLSNLVLSAGTLVPTFDADTTTYEASVSNANSSITVTPTVQVAGATLQVRVNGGSYVGVTSGVASGALALNVGNNTIEVLVTAQDGTTTKLYTVTVNRAQPPVVIAIQDFETVPATPTWSYTGGGSVNSTANKFNGASSYRISSNQVLTMSNIDISGYTNVQLSVAFAGEGPDSGEDLMMDISFDNGSTWNGSGSIMLVDGFSNTSLNINNTSSSGIVTVASNPWLTSISSTENQISVRFRITGSATTTEYYFIDDVVLTGNVSTSPLIVVTPSSLTNFNQTSSTPSTEQSFTVSGDNLTDNVVITPPTGYEISTTTGGAFSATNPINLAVSGGNVVNEPVTIYVRQVAVDLGPISGNISLTSSGATTKTVAVSGVRTGRYYSKATGDLNVLSTWGVETDGTGSAPASFTSDGAIYEIRNRAAATIGANWTVSGASSKVVLGDGSNAVDFTIPSTFSLNGTIDISNQAELTIQNTTLPTFGVLASQSSIEFNNVSITMPNSLSYANLKLSGTGIKTFAGGTTTINGNLILDNTEINGGSGPFSTINILGNIEYIGTVTPPVDANSITLQTSGASSGTQTINANNNVLRWFRITSTTANTIVVNNASNVLLGNASGGGITLVNNSVLDLSGNNLQLFNSSSTTAAFVLNTSGVIAVNDNTNFLIERTGSGSLGTLRFKSDANTLGSFTYNHTGATNTITIGNTLNIANVLEVQNGTIQSNGNIVLKSTNSSSARVAPVGVGASITGNVVVERHIPAKRAWRFLTAPVTGNTNNSVYFNWQNNGAAGNNGTGVNLWLPAGGNGLVAGGGSPNIYKYKTVAPAGWDAITNTQTEALFTNTTNNAFMVFVTGGANTTNIASGATATTMAATGALRVGDVNYGNLPANIHTLIGNPYASPISPLAVLNGNPGFRDKLWVLDPQIGSVGQYVIYDKVAGYTNISGSYQAGTNIQSGQAFFVRRSSLPENTAATFTITEAHKATVSDNGVFDRNATQSITIDKLRLSLWKNQSEQAQNLDAVLAVFYDNGNNAVDMADGGKINGVGENLALMNGTSAFTLEHRATAIPQDVLPVRVSGMQEGANYQLRVQTEGFNNPNVEVFLHDTFTNTVTPIPTDDTVVTYPFAVTSATASTGNRFQVLFQNSPLGVSNPEGFSQAVVYPNPVNDGMLHIALPTATYQKVSLYNALGQVVYQQNALGTTNLLQVSTQGLANGYYQLQVEDQQGQKYQAKVIINQ
ncbi:MAG: cadherin-like beta sandwich domain-containing protein [Flavobacterium sp.]